MKYLGGKSKLNSWLQNHLAQPGITTFIDAMCGSGVVGRNHPAKHRVLNDANQPQAALLLALKHAPFALIEAIHSDIQNIDPLDRKGAHALFRAQWPTLPPDLLWLNNHYSFRGGGDRWFSEFSEQEYQKMLAQTKADIRLKVMELHYQLKDCDLHCCDIKMLIKQFGDCPETLYYLDPPYLGRDGRDSRHKNGQTRMQYAHDMLTEQSHKQLLDLVLGLKKSPVAISHKPYPLYDSELKGWTRFDCLAKDLCRQDKPEAVYLNPVALERLEGNAIAEFAI